MCQFRRSHARSSAHANAAQGFVDDYAESAREVADELVRKTGEMRDKATGSLIETVEARPFATLAAILGLGFLAGYLCRRS